MNWFVKKNHHENKIKFSVSRRQTLIGLANFSVATSLCCGCQSFARESVNGNRIDLHHHYFPERTKQITKKIIGAFPPIQDYSAARSIEAMDEAGIRKSYLSLPMWFDRNNNRSQREKADFAREMNESGARIRSDFSGRFGLFAFLPLPDIDASLLEIEYVFDALKVDGVGLLTNYGNRWLGNQHFRPVLDELNRRSAVVYTHPTDAPCCHNLVENTLPNTLEWNTNTSRAIWSMINDGTDRPPVTTPRESMATRYSDIQFIWSHAGGTILGLIGRFLGQSGNEPVDLSPEQPPNSKLHHLRRFYFDTAGSSANPIQMRALKDLVGASQIVLGSDYPFVAPLQTVEGLKECGFSAAELQGIERGNALRIVSA